ncbi:MAG: glycosyltransferase family 2 protein [Candidatus Levybacteria bacterium]|nr:glycosyltransferase family 2 protein [Candidatus Levybacteria bacterium]
MKVVVIPATYNEKGNIEQLIAILEEEVFPKIKDYDMNILVADDNSPDGTADIVRGLGKKWKNLGVNVGEKKGLGAAYIRVMSCAIEEMGADIVVQIDADLSHDPREIPKFLDKIKNGYDIAIGTRYSDGGSMPINWPLHRKAFSVCGNILVRIITFRFYIHDWTGGMRAIKKDLFLKIREEVRPYQGYTFQVALLYKSILAGYKIAEVPIHFADRKEGHSKIAPFEYIINLLRYVIGERIIELRRFIKFLIVGGIGFIVMVVAQELSIIYGLSSWLASVFYTTQSIVGGGIEQLPAHSQGIATSIGAEFAILSNFLLNNIWTFSDAKNIKNKSSFIIRLLKFNTASFIAILIQGVSTWIGVVLIGQNINIFGFSILTRIAILFPTIILLIIPLNYFIYNRLIWKTHLKNSENY